MKTPLALSDYIGLPARVQKTAGLHLFIGSRLLPAWTLAALCPLLTGDNGVFWIEGRHGFDAHALGKMARARGLDPKGVLSRVQLARPFSAFQIEALVTKKLPALAPSRPVILSDPLSLFYDEELPEKDARRTFAGFLDGLKALAVPVLGLVVERESPRRKFLDELLGISRGTARLTEDGPFPRLEKI